MATYKPPVYDEKKYMKGINTSFYDNAIKNYAAQANQQRATQLGEAQKTQQSALKNAYISRLQNERQMNTNLARAGIRGGATETANLGIMNTYGQATAAANADYANSVNSINQNFDQNISDYTMDMQSRKQEYLTNTAQAKWQAAREDYANRFNAAREDRENKINRQREDKANAYERKQAETQRQTEYWSNYYTNFYSGWSEKKIKKELKVIEKRIKNAKTPYAKIRWQQAKAALGGRRGVIATSK